MGEGINLSRRAALRRQSPGVAIDSLPEGTLIGLSEGGVLTPFILLGHDFDALTNGSGLTVLLRKQLWMPTIRWDYKNSAPSTAPDYSTSDIDAWLVGTYYPMLSAQVRARLPSVTLQYTCGDTKLLSTIVRKVFLLSLTECGMPTNPNYTYNDEGERLTYCTTDTVYRAFDANNTKRRWWTRTPDTNATSVFVMSEISVASNYPTSNSMACARPALCMRGNTAVSASPNEDGLYLLA